MKIVISPAKSIDYKKIENSNLSSIPLFLKDTESLVTKMKKFSSKKIAEMMHLSKDLSDLNYNRYQNWESPVVESSTIFPAISAFNGEVYKGFDVHTLSKGEIENSQNNLRILSGLYGILKPMDLIYPYRLEMGTKWKITPKINNLYDQHLHDAKTRFFSTTSAQPVTACSQHSIFEYARVKAYVDKQQ